MPCAYFGDITRVRATSSTPSDHLTLWWPNGSQSIHLGNLALESPWSEDGILKVWYRIKLKENKITCVQPSSPEESFKEESIVPGIRMLHLKLISVNRE